MLWSGYRRRSPHHQGFPQRSHATFQNSHEAATDQHAAGDDPAQTRRPAQKRQRTSTRTETHAHARRWLIGIGGDLPDATINVLEIAPG